MGQPKPIIANKFLFRINVKRPRPEDAVEIDELVDLIARVARKRRTPRFVVRDEMIGNKH